MAEQMNILVTGGAGYIGSHACRALAGSGYMPVTYDNLSKGRASAVRWGPLEEGDTLNGIRLAEVFDQYRPAAVMHFAAAIEVDESVTDPGKYWRNNFQGSLTLAGAMHSAECDKIVYSSTCAVYDGASQVDLTEDSPIGPINAYGGSKRATEIQAMIFRYFNVAARPGAPGSARHMRVRPISSPGLWPHLKGASAR